MALRLTDSEKARRESVRLAKRAEREKKAAESRAKKDEIKRKQLWHQYGFWCLRKRGYRRLTNEKCPTDVREIWAAFRERRSLTCDSCKRILVRECPDGAAWHFGALVDADLLALPLPTEVAKPLVDSVESPGKSLVRSPTTSKSPDSRVDTESA